MTSLVTVVTRDVTQVAWGRVIAKLSAQITSAFPSLLPSFLGGPSAGELTTPFPGA